MDEVTSEEALTELAPVSKFRVTGKYVAAVDGSDMF